MDPSIKAIAIGYANLIWNEKRDHAIDQFIDEKVVIHSILGDFHGKKAMKEVV